MMRQQRPQAAQTSRGNAALYIQETSNQREGLDRWLGWWYRYTAPPQAPANADLEQREIVRRGRLASTILFFLAAILIFLVGPIGAFGPNHQILLTAAIILVLIAICIPINRSGHVNVVGVIVSLSVNIGIYASILRSPGGISPGDLGMFDMLVFSEVFVASLLPIFWVIPDAVLNILFCYCVLTYWQKTPLLLQIMHGSGYFSVISRPIQIHFIVSGVLYLWVWSANRAIRRADRAEEIAKLQHDIAAQQQAIISEKQQLDADVQAILQTHVQASNGRLDARVSLQEGAILWPIAGSLNNLLSRMQRLKVAEQQLQKLLPRIQRASQMEFELQRIQEAVLALAGAIHVSDEAGQVIHSSNSGTVVDMLAAELNGKQIAK
jgi:hypothetical protein